MFDITASGEGGQGFLPLVVPFNEPILGFGLTAALAYFHPRAEGAPAEYPKGGKIPPSATFGGGAYSQNDSWVVMAGHSGVWRDGRVRYLGAIGYSSFNLEFFGFGGEVDTSLPFNIEGGMILQQAEFELGDSHWFLGGRYSYLNADVTLENRTLEFLDGNTQNAGLAAFASYDSRDTTFTPNHGTRAKLSYTWFAEALGGDFDYDRVDMKLFHYWPIDRVVLGLRLEASRVGTESPFYAKPWVQLRAVPALRYLGNYSITAEVEPRVKIDERWSVLGFAGAGTASLRRDRIDDSEMAWSYGVGFRYLLSRGLGLGAGLDLARSSDRTMLLIAIGTTWGS